MIYCLLVITCKYPGDGAFHIFYRNPFSTEILEQILKVSIQKLVNIFCLFHFSSGTGGVSRCWVQCVCHACIQFVLLLIGCFEGCKWLFRLVSVNGFVCLEIEFLSQNILLNFDVKFPSAVLVSALKIVLFSLILLAQVHRLKLCCYHFY